MKVVASPQSYSSLISDMRACWPTRTPPHAILLLESWLRRCIAAPGDRQWTKEPRH